MYNNISTIRNCKKIGKNKKKNNFTEYTRKYFICSEQHVYMHMYYAHIESTAWEGMGKLYRTWIHN